jgi:hypothetical protein
MILLISRSCQPATTASAPTAPSDEPGDGDDAFSTCIIECICFCVCEREFVASNDKPQIVAYRYIIEASKDVP